MMHWILLTGVLACLLGPAVGFAEAPEAPAASNLRVEYVRNPMAVDTGQPRFSWHMEHPGRDQFQSACQVVVVSSLDRLDAPDLWDSGRTETDNNVHFEYGGAALAPRTRYYWTVRLWDAQGNPGPFAEPSWFETGIMGDTGDAEWVRGPLDQEDHNGFHSAVLRRDRPQFVQVDLGRPAAISEVRLYPARPYDWEPDTPGFGFPLRYRLVIARDEAGNDPVLTIDRTGEDQPNPGEQVVSFPVDGVEGRYVRLEATKLFNNGQGQYMLCLAEMEVLDTDGDNVALGADVTASSRHEHGGWSRARLVNGVRRSRRASTTSPMMRREFTLRAPVRRARAYASALGYYELYLNGRRVGDRVLDPANTVRDKRAVYSAYDVTDLLREGGNGAGFMLGHGWHRGKSPAAWLQLLVEYEDGSSEMVVTDDAWTWATGPILEESLWHGETYDARCERDGWAEPGYPDADWQPVTSYETPPPVLDGQIMPPIRVVETLPAEKLTPMDDGSVVVDFGQNLTGWMRLRVAGPEGTEVVMRHAELVYPDGSINPENLRSARATNRYILRGSAADAPEFYEPRFTQHGFRYAQISGYPGELKLDDVQARVVHTDFVRAGAFACSHGLYNDIRDITLWSIRGNSMSIPTDCPQRDERMGWMGDAHLAAETTILNFDACAYYENWLRVIANSQDERGYVPDTAPLEHYGMQEGSPPWAIAYPLITWYLYRYYGNERVVEEHYDNLVRWFGTLEASARDHIIHECRYGDWVGIEGTPDAVISTGCYYWTADILAELAEALAKTTEAQAFRSKKRQIGEAYHQAFFHEDRGYYEDGSQFSQIWPLYLGIAPVGVRPRVLEKLEHEIMVHREGHLATGILGTKYVFDVLSDASKVDIAYTVSQQRDYPSWGYMLDNGATTLWELWRLETGPGMNSHNHQMFGSVVDWFFGRVAGIGTLPEAAYRRFTVAPLPGGGLNSAEAFIDTVNGRIESSWRRSEDEFTLAVRVPPNTRARVVLPRAGLAAPEALHDGEPVAPDLAFGEGIELGSGNYRFVVRPGG